MSLLFDVPHNLIKRMFRAICVRDIEILLKHVLAWTSFLFLPTTDRCAVHRFTH